MIGYIFPKGVRSLKKTEFNPVYVLVRPPSLEILVSNSIYMFITCNHGSYHIQQNI